ncbi:MAG: endo alpha-1,4 polygalactosaminidase [Leifsonia sp.]
MLHRIAASGILVGVAVLALDGCAAPAVSDAASRTASTVRLPPADARFDYQLGAAYTPPQRVAVVERDRTAAPAGAGYDICYVNGFQTQPADSRAFASEHPELVVQTPDGPLVDEGWPDEYLFDTSTPDKRAALEKLVGSWIRGCAHSGFAAVEIDNLDSYTRSEGVLSAKDNLDLAARYARIAHDAGLAIAQKNTADQTKRLKDLGYDFAVTESCYRFSECDAYTAVYPVVLDIEYDDELGAAAFGRACADTARPKTMILRDHSLVGPDDAGYVYRSC